MGVTYFLLLSSLGLAITIQAQDCSRPVGKDNMNLKDTDILKDTFPDGTKVSFSCNIGYVTGGGSATITCTAGTWSPVILTCERRNCGSAADVLNGHVEYHNGTQFGDKLVITCKPGYTLVGNSQIVCGAQGWLSRMPECEGMTCEPPLPVENADFNPKKDSYMIREVVKYTCQKDYTLYGSQSISCLEDGRFESLPNCTMVECADPVIDDAEWVQGSRPPHRYMASVTYKCRPGFTMIGARTITCGIDRQWSPKPPRCEALPKTTKATTTTTTTTTTTRPRKPTALPGPTDPPGNDGNSLSIGLGIGLPVLIILLTVCGCYFCGVPAILKKKRRSPRGYPDNGPSKDGEEAVALS